MINLVNALKNLCKVIPTGRHTPYNLVRLTSQHDALVLRTTNGEVQMQTMIDMVESSLGEFNIYCDAKILLALLKSTKGHISLKIIGETLYIGDAAISLLEPHAWLKQKYDFNLNPTALKSLDSDEFVSCFDKVSMACSSHEYQAMFQGVCFKTKGKNKMILVATDGYRLHISPTIKGVISDQDFIIHKNVLKLLLPMIKASKDFGIEYQNEKTILFSSNDIIANVPLMEGSFPSFERVIPSNFIADISVDKNEMVALLNRLKPIVANIAHNEVVINVTDDELTFNANGIEYQTSEVMKAKVEKCSELEVLSFNLVYLLDAIRSRTGDLVTMKIASISNITLIEEGGKGMAMVVPLSR